MKFNISFNAPTLPDKFYLTKYNWKFIEDNIDETDKEFFSSVNYSFLEWKDGVRHGSCFVAAHGLIIDYDNKGNVITTIDEIKQFLAGLDVNYIIANSKSHTPEVPRYHILFPFENKVTSADTYSALMHNFMAMLPGQPDGSVHDTARFMGYTPKEKLVEYHCVEGKFFVDQLIIPNKTEEKKIVREHKKELKTLSSAKGNGYNKPWKCTDELLELIVDEHKHIINCPLECNAHEKGKDQNKSAFVNFNEKSDNWYIYCSVCSPALNGGKVFWMKKDIEFIEKYLLKTTKESK